MKSHGYSGEGIILARRNFGEADRILVIYSKDHGKISLIAKGVRKPKSRKRGHIEVFSQLRFQAIKTGSLDIITEAETINSFEDIRTDLKKISVAYYFVEIIGKSAHEGEKNSEVYYLLVDHLSQLSNSTATGVLRKSFLTKLLTMLGYWPLGVKMDDPDKVLEEVVERKINSARVGKKVLQ